MAGVPHSSSSEGMLSESTSRRISGRARKPTSKFEALVGTKFNPADHATSHMTDYSESTVPSISSMGSTPISSQSNSNIHPDETQTSPSTVSINPSIELNSDSRARSKPTIDGTSPAESIKRESQRSRKPTQRALEATGSMPTTRRPGQPKNGRESSEMRISATPSENSTALEQSFMFISTESTPSIKTQARKSVLGEIASKEGKQDNEGNKSEPSSVHNTPASSTPHSEELASAPLPSTSGRRRRSHVNGIENAHSEQQNTESPSPGPTRSRSSTTRINRPGQVPATKLELRSSTEQSKDLTDAQSNPKIAVPAEDNNVGLAAQRPRRTQREAALNSDQPSRSLKNHQATERDTIQERPKRSVNKPASYAMADDDEEDAVVHDMQNSPVRRSRRGRSDSLNVNKETKQQVTLKITNHAASPAPEEPQKKSLKLTLKAAGLKAPRLPSKLRYSILLQEEADSSSALMEQSNKNTDVEKEITSRNRVKGKAKEKTPMVPVKPIKQDKSSMTIAQPSSQPSPPLPPQKLSRRAQAKADAKAMGKVRQAAVPLTEHLHQGPAYVASASHYVPSAGLLSPAMGCKLFCLDPPARILAFAQIAAESNDSDEEDSSDNGQPPRLYEKWLDKGRDRFCVCDKPSHAHSHQVEADMSSSDVQPQAATSNSVEVEQVLNEDVAAAIPGDAVIPLSVPPVNSIMRKSQGRRVSALYNILEDSSSSVGSVGDSNPSLSHSHSPATNTGGAPGRVQGVLHHAHQSFANEEIRSPTSFTPSESGTRVDGESTATLGRPPHPSSGLANNIALEKRMSCDQRMLERPDKETEETGTVVPLDISYDESRAALQVDRDSHRDARSPHSTAPPLTQGRRLFLAMAEWMNEGFDTETGTVVPLDILYDKSRAALQADRDSHRDARSPHSTAPSLTQGRRLFLAMAERMNEGFDTETGTVVPLDILYDKSRAALQADRDSYRDARSPYSTAPSLTRGRRLFLATAARLNEGFAEDGTAEFLHSESASDDPALNAKGHVDHGSDRPLPSADDEDDRLMQIIGDSVRVTKERNAAKAPLLGSPSTSPKRKGAPANPSEMSGKRLKTSAANETGRRMSVGTAAAEIHEQHKQQSQLPPNTVSKPSEDLSRYMGFVLRGPPGSEDFSFPRSKPKRSRR